MGGGGWGRGEVDGGGWRWMGVGGVDGGGGRWMGGEIHEYALVIQCFGRRVIIVKC